MISAARILQIKIKPNARVSRFIELADGSWQASVKSPPVDGKANDELISLVARHFGVAKARVEIKRGVASRLKQITIAP